MDQFDFYVEAEETEQVVLFSSDEGLVRWEGAARGETGWARAEGKQLFIVDWSRKQEIH